MEATDTNREEATNSTEDTTKDATEESAGEDTNRDKEQTTTVQGAGNAMDTPLLIKFGIKLLNNIHLLVPLVLYKMFAP
jgi:hypothetical protein